MVKVNALCNRHGYRQVGAVRHFRTGLLHNNDIDRAKRDLMRDVSSVGDSAQSGQDLFCSAINSIYL